MKAHIIPLLISILVVLSGTAFGRNMNGPRYRIANVDSFQPEYGDDEEFFDVYSPLIQSLYSQVHWASHDNIPLPQEIIDRFSGGKGLAITGYEVDQVRVDDKGNEVSVPITWAYNHHYMAWMYNSKTIQMVQSKVDTVESYAMSHGAPTYWHAQPRNPTDSYDLPQAHFISEGNGGEMRRSYHGYPRGYAQIIQSPDTFHVTPMQIDTWNRNMTNATFIPGPRPRSSRIPDSAGYNGLLECPCSDRLPIEWHMEYKLDKGDCQATIENATECFKGARTIVPSAEFHTSTIDDDDLPKGCSITFSSDGSMRANWNKNRDANLDANAISQARNTQVVAVTLGDVNATVSVDINSKSKDAVQLVLTGPAEQWFGVGFGADSMCIHSNSEECPEEGPYAIVIRGDIVEERKLGYHGPGKILLSSLRISSNEVDANIRTVHLSRAIDGITEDHYTFEVDPADELPAITATGCGLEFKQHCSHASLKFTWMPVDLPQPICRSSIVGSIGGNPFHKDCHPFPESVLLQQQNPTCKIQTYRGGLSCCRHGQFLLDQDQDIPWKDQPLEYRLKFRFYFEEYIPEVAQPSSKPSPSHKNLARFYWQTEAWASEYDVPQCDNRTPQNQCVHSITSEWQIHQMNGYGPERKGKGRPKGIKLIYAAPHCHAPSCLSMELYDARTGHLLCHVEPIFGKGQDGVPYDEKGYVAIPPCLWSEDGGTSKEGLPEPIFLPMNATLMSIKRNNNTLPHTGEMASWQMRGVWVYEDDDDEDEETAFSTSKLTTSSRRSKLPSSEEEKRWLD